MDEDVELVGGEGTCQLLRKAVWVYGSSLHAVAVPALTQWQML